MPQKPSAKKPATPRRAKSPARVDPTTDLALLALDASYAAPPDMPISIAQQEIASLARLAASRAKELLAVGINASKIQTLTRFAARLKELETSWQRARRGAHLTGAEREHLAEAETLETKLVAAGRWACRNDKDAQEELSRIAEGSGLADTVEDLGALVQFWSDHEDALGQTKITKKDLTRARKLITALEPAAEKEHQSADAAAALELRNRGFWAADELAKEIREGGRYAFNDQPKLAAKFVSRYRTSIVRRSRRKIKEATNAPGAEPAQPNDA
jgi:hypothetical protein